MHTKTTETEQVGFGKAMGELLAVAVVAFVFAFGADYGLSGLLNMVGIHPHPATTAAPGPAPADAGDD